MFMGNDPGNSGKIFLRNKMRKAAERQNMRPESLLRALATSGRLKENTRHCWISADRKESVADHSWRLALMAMLLENEPEFSDIDMSKIIRMCLIHDLGEAFTGDIPAFEKTEQEEAREDELYQEWVNSFPENGREEWMQLLGEYKEQKTKEATITKALDKLEAVISHNESDIHTWLPLEYDLQKTYGKENMDASPYFLELRQLVDEWTDKKIEVDRGC